MLSDDHYPFPAQSIVSWSGCCPEAVVSSFQRLDHIETRPIQLNGIYRTLAKHHSFDPRFLARIKSAMELQPWKCACVRLNKKVALTCASCKWGYAPAPQAWQWDQITWPIRGTISRRSKRLKATDPQIRIEQIAPTNRIARIAQLKENQTLLAPKAQGSALLRHIADNVGPRKSASGEEKILLQSVPATTPASSSMSSAEEQLRIR